MKQKFIRRLQALLWFVASVPVVVALLLLVGIFLPLEIIAISLKYICHRISILTVKGFYRFCLAVYQWGCLKLSTFNEQDQRKAKTKLEAIKKHLESMNQNIESLQEQE